jgi:peptidoglycan/xylan/chitin deacetylase (PgdA/CDA1 family)
MNESIAVYLNCNKNFREEAKYTIQILFKILGISYREVSQEEIQNIHGLILFYYGSIELNIPQDNFKIQISAVDYWRDLKQLSYQNVLWMNCTDSFKFYNISPPNLFYLFSKTLPQFPDVWYTGKSEKTPLISSDFRNLHCSIDLISSAFYLLSLEAERKTSNRDEYGRFHKKYSPIGEEIYNKPLIDNYAKLIELYIKNAEQNINVKVRTSIRWPEKRRFSLVLSHDVDRIRSWTIGKVLRTYTKKSDDNKYFEILKRRIAILSSVFTPTNWSGNFKYISDLESKYEAKSTFFLVSEPRVSKDPRYRLDQKRLRKGIALLKMKGNHIGLHGSFSSLENADFLKFEKHLLEQTIGKTIYGNRQHYLRFNVKTTLDVIAKSHFKYDSTLGFVSELGYRCGTSFPFRPWNQKKRKSYEFWEIPLILMDTVFFLKNKLNLSVEQVWTYVQEHLEVAFNLGGCLTINWHSNNIHSRDLTGYTNLYKKMLNWAKQRNAWICSTDEVWDWWINRRIGE